MEMNDGDTPSLAYEVLRSQELGRYLVAVRNIEAREIIIREDPLISGPSDRGPKDIPACLGCSRLMVNELTNRCTKCRWPVCNEDCQKRNHVVYPPPYGWPLINKCIIILRCLLLKRGKPSEWEKLMNMSDNKEIRNGKPKCITSDKRILENFAAFFPNNINGTINDAEEGFSTEEVTRISGIIDTNAHAFPLKINNNEQSTIVCNLYSQTSLMAHSCAPNASWSGDKALSSLTLTIRANVPIAKGDMISVAYDEGQLLVCTLKRLVPNEINGMFVCKCRRCMDPTELGSFVGALKCPSCTQGYLLPIDPVDSFSNWKCDRNNSSYNNDTNGGHNGDNNKTPVTSKLCRADVPFPASMSNVSERTNGGGKCNNNEEEICDADFDDESITDMILDAESTCGYSAINLGLDPPAEDEGILPLLKEFVEDYTGTILHPNHYILQEVNVRIIKGDYAKGLSTLSDLELTQFLDRCERLLRVADLLTPGYCEYRGLLYLERRMETKRKDHQESQLKSRREVEDMRGNDGNNKVKHGPLIPTNIHNSVEKEEENGCDGGGASSLQTMKNEDGNEKYGNSLANLKRLMEMLTFLSTYFKELNSSHKLLKPIMATIIETEMKLKGFQGLD